MPKTEPNHDPISAYAREVLSLYSGALAEVSFPDLDLSRLTDAHDAARAAQLALEASEAALESARSRLQVELAALAATSQRALAYARVFAHDDAGLQARISQIEQTELPMPTASVREPKKRGRKPKAQGDAQLFATAEVTQLMAAGEQAVSAA